VQPVRPMSSTDSQRNRPSPLSSSGQADAGVHILLDTSFCLHLIRTRPRHLLQAFASYGPNEVAVSALTVAALQARAEASRSPEQNRMALERFLLPLRVVEFDAEAAHVLGEVIARWGVQPGGGAGLAQMLAAQALLLDATLVSADPSQYAAVPGLRVNGPAAAALVGEVPPPRAVDSHVPAIAKSRPLHSVPGAIVAVGSHDMTLDLLGDYLHSRHPQVTLVSAHVGSLGGLLALQRNEAHLAGSHLLDEESGDYNRAHIERLLTPHGIHVVLLGFVSRQQGLILARGNPKGIEAVEDLARDDVRFVNRQQGAGTRVLLDHALREAGIDGTQIQGYERQESSHAAVAAAVAGGEADCGLGIQAAAQAHGLAFVPLFSERYDLVIPAEHYESELLAPMLALLRNPPPEFLGRVAALGGYETPLMGKVLAEL
jgi:molybdate-binding protein/predicted nucleic acid-binding protein